MQASAKGRVIAWVLAGVLGAANIAGYTADLYQRFWWFDRVIHGATIMAITLWVALFVFAPSLRSHRPALTVLLIASVGVAIGAVWEVMEWGFDLIAPGNVIKGKYDTVVDIVMDTAGALLGGALSIAFLKRDADDQTRIAVQ